ncbi:TRAP transporter large permease subunit [Aurantivibrio infirmus]
MIDLIPLFLFAAVCLFLILGFPVAFTLAGTALLAAGLGIIAGVFDPKILLAFPDRIFGIMNNQILIAVPLFVLMGVMLEKSRISEELLENMTKVFGRFPGGLGIAVILVGALLAASTGVVGATVVTMGLMSLPTMLKRGYSPSLSTGTICATGTLGQIIPPSIALVLLGDALSSAYQQAQINMGIDNPLSISVGDLFVGAIIPGLVLVLLYLSYLIITATLNPKAMPPAPTIKNAAGSDFDGDITVPRLLLSLLPPLILIVCVLGSIIAGVATPTEAAGLGALGACVLAFVRKQFNVKILREVAQSTTKISAMVFTILLGASLFSLVFRGFGGDSLIEGFFQTLPGGTFTAILIVMIVIFLLGFILDFIEITFIVVPIIGPILLAMDINPIWLGIMIAVNLQTSFLTPPFGFALFYLRGVTPASIPTTVIYRGVIPFIVIQLLLMISMAVWPQIITWLPQILSTN